ncbi:hypothetical protein FHT77_006260 [Rhizobium sp. BK181]|nr:hypothetical protein [Rhizobium sp. BK181]
MSRTIGSDPVSTRRTKDFGILKYISDLIPPAGGAMSLSPRMASFLAKKLPARVNQNAAVTGREEIGLALT